MYYAFNKLLQAVLTIFLVSLVIFMLFQIIPGDPILSRLGDAADPVLEEALRSQFGLDKPAFTRYMNWVGNVLRGDLGISIRFNRPVAELIMDRLPNTLALAMMAFAIIVLFGLPLGILAARFSKDARGVLFNILTQIGTSVPSFFLAILLLLFFSLRLGWFDVMGYVSYKDNFFLFLKGLFLPAVAIAVASMATLARYTRASVLEQMSMDYVRTARNKGVTQRKILYRHVLRNALIPILTILGILLTSVLSGVIVVEAAFSIPGIGNLLHGGIKNRDLPLVQGISLYISAMVVLVFFIIDILYHIIDPRVDLEGARKGETP